MTAAALRTQVSTEVAIIGAGPAGLSAASRLAGTHRRRVLVLDREQSAGGIPRHSDHLGYGIRDLRTFISGPAYAHRLTRRAETAGAHIVTRAMVTAINPDNSLDVTTPEGLQRITAAALVLATGARERPRPARLIPGDRPAGVYTTGHLQNIVHLHHGTVGKRAVVVGAELVSWSAVMTLRHAGADTVLVTSQYRSPESYGVFNLGGRAMFRVPIATRSRLTRIIGRPTVQAVEIENLDSGERRVINCDTVVFTGDWIPDHELARSAGIEIDPATKGPLVDTALHTSRQGVFAAGNVVHPVDTADIAALDGMFVADEVHRCLSSPGEGDDARAATETRIHPALAGAWSAVARRRWSATRATAGVDRPPGAFSQSHCLPRRTRDRRQTLTVAGHPGPCFPNPCKPSGSPRPTSRGRDRGYRECLRGQRDNRRRGPHWSPGQHKVAWPEMGGDAVFTADEYRYLAARREAYVTEPVDQT